MREIKQRLSGRGLKGLKLVLVPGSKRFAVMAKASPWQRVDEFVPKTTFTAQDLQLIGSKRGATDYAPHTSVIALAGVDRQMVREIGRFDSVGRHAERNFAQDLEARWGEYVRSYYSEVKGVSPERAQGKHRFEFLAKITRGPCGECTSALLTTRARIRTAAARTYPNVTVDLVIRSTGAYGKVGYTYSDPNRGPIRNEPGNPRAGQFQIWRLLQQGISVGILTLDDPATQAVQDTLDGRRQWYIGKVNQELRDLLNAIKNRTVTF